MECVLPAAAPGRKRRKRRSRRIRRKIGREVRALRLLGRLDRMQRPDTVRGAARCGAQPRPRAGEGHSCCARLSNGVPLFFPEAS